MKTVDQTAEVGVLIGRFQVPELHDAHKQVIKQVVDSHPRVFLFLGLSPLKCTRNNPLDFQSRKAMIEQAFPSVEIFYIYDIGNNELWSKELDTQISRQIGPNQKCVLYGSRDSFLDGYKGKYPTVELVPDRIISGKEIRKNVGIKSKNTPAFREGVVWAVENQFSSVHPTVDIAIIDGKTNRILLAKKPNNELLRFVGGFADVNSESYEADADREVREETGLECVNYKYIGSCKIDDWRYRAESNKIKTLFFICDYYTGTPVAQDDIAEVQWRDISTLTINDFVPEHRPLWNMLQDYLKFTNVGQKT